MKVFVTGVGGQLGHDVMLELKCRGMEAIGSDLAPGNDSYTHYVSLDITDAAAVEKAIGEAAADVVIHCAAWTAVDLAEEKAELVHAINATGTQNIANVCKQLSC